MRPAQEPIDISRDLVSLLPRLHRFALTLTRNGPDADDLVQAVCERATGRQPVWNGHGRLETALYTLTRAVWTDTAGKSRTPAEVDPSRMGESAFSKPVQQMIIDMPEGLASIFLLVAVESHSYRETAAILALPEDAIREKLASARATLAAISSTTTQRRA